MDCTPKRIEAKLKILLQMSLVLVWGARVPLVRIGRIAGQYMKPRSKPTEVRVLLHTPTPFRLVEPGQHPPAPPVQMVDGEEVYAYKGDSINSFDMSARTPDPERLKQVWQPCWRRAPAACLLLPF
jgi:3-deoxy-D-arabino-heptulosonate 7-phosphate (DAHP) synthase class II